MNDQERHLIEELFDRLSRLETTPRDADAESAIMQGLRRAPNAAYALVQMVLLQDEALKRANARLEELEGRTAAPSQPASFLSGMRDALFGSQPDRGSVPSVRSQDVSRPVWNSGEVNARIDPRNAGAGFGSPYSPSGYGSGGGSFLGTAAGAVAGVIGGSLLMSGIRGLMGGHEAFADPGAFGHQGAPWTDRSESGLAHDAGIDDIGRPDHFGDAGARQGLFDDAPDGDDGMIDDDVNDDGFDPGGGSDYA